MTPSFRSCPPRPSASPTSPSTPSRAARPTIRACHAIAAAINYAALIKNLQRGYAKQINSLLSPLAFGYDTSLPDNRYDPGTAKKMIDEAGVRGATVVMATSPSSNPQIVQAIQADLAAVGLEVEIHNTDQATHLKKVQAPAHDWGAVRFGRWSCSCLAADGVVYPLFHTGGIWSSYSNPAFDKLVEQARTVTRVRQHDKVASIGVLPSPLARPSGCAFSSRCPLATDRCHQETRALRVLTQGRSAAWHHAETAQVGAA